MVVGGRIGSVEALPAVRTEAGAVFAANDLIGQREDQRVASPGGEIENPVLDVRALKLRCTGQVLLLFIGTRAAERDRLRWLINFAGVDPDSRDRRLEATEAGTYKPDLEAQPQGETGAGPRDVKPKIR